jgi:hypothetical protein
MNETFVVCIYMSMSNSISRERETNRRMGTHRRTTTTNKIFATQQTTMKELYRDDVVSSLLHNRTNHTRTYLISKPRRREKDHAYMRMVLEICRWIDLVVYRCIRSRRHRVTTHPEPKKKSVPPSHRTPCLSCPGTLVCLEAGCITGRQAQQVQTSHRKSTFRAYTHHVYVCPTSRCQCLYTVILFGSEVYLEGNAWHGMRFQFSNGMNLKFRV